MHQRFTLDVPSLQKLLEAAWVLQCERDRELSKPHSGVTVLAVPSDNGQWNAAIPLTSPGGVFEPACAVAETHTSQICEVAGPIVVPSQLPVEPTYPRAEVAGALALAADLVCSPPRDLVTYSAPDVKKPAQSMNETAVVKTSQRVALTLVPFRDEDAKDKHKDDKDAKHPLSARTASTLRRPLQVTTAYAAPVVVLLIMSAFVFSLLAIHRPALTAVKAAPSVLRVAQDRIAPDKIAPDKIAPSKIVAHDSPAPDHVGQPQSPAAAASAHPQTDSPVLEPAVPEPSHLRVTDPAASSLVASLSRYEIQTVLHQAQYGDAVAALTLGMAYEIGHNVPRSCTQAAHWVAVAAEEGNSAAQYNLALRYISGDGTPTNLDEARKWLEKAAGHGYQKARLTLQAPGL
jgi:Sel1 repeat